MDGLGTKGASSFGFRFAWADLTEDEDKHVDGCQNYGPFLGPLNTRCRIILRTHTGTIILPTTRVGSENPPKLETVQMSETALLGLTQRVQVPLFDILWP